MNREVLVIGSGIAGIQAALGLADIGIHAHLVERKPNIGGPMAQLDRSVSVTDCLPCIPASRIAECPRHPNATGKEAIR